MNYPEPSTIYAGDSLSWTKSPPEYPADAGWTLEYYLIGPAQITITTTVSGSDHVVSVTASTTGAWGAGDYWWSAIATKGAERKTIDGGQLTVYPDPKQLTVGHDGRSQIKKTLDAIESLLLGKASADVNSYSIAGRAITKMSPEELLKWRDVYRTDYKAEQKAARIERGLGGGGKVLARFA